MFFISCDQQEITDPFTTVKGTITDYYTGDSLENINLIIKKKESMCLYFCDADTLAEITTDSKGYYEFSFECDTITDWDYVIYVLKSGSHWNLDEKPIGKGKMNEFNFKVKPIKYLTLHFQKTYNNRLYVYSYLNNEIYDCYNCDSIIENTYRMIPEKNNDFQIFSRKIIENGEFDDSHRIDQKFEFYTGKNDTTIYFEY